MVVFAGMQLPSDMDHPGAALGNVIVREGEPDVRFMLG